MPALNFDIMKNMIRAVVVSLGVAALAGCASKPSEVSPKPAAATGSPAATPAAAPESPAPAGTNELNSERARVSYAVGMMLGHNFQLQGVEVDSEMVARGMKDLQGGKTLLTTDEMRTTLADYQKTVQAKREEMRLAAAGKNKADGMVFLATNHSNPGVITLTDGLQYKVITDGTGPQPGSNDIVTVNYRGTLLDGTEFDNSYKRGKPAQFPVNQVIPGWTEALQKMHVGSKWELFIPSDLAYGEQGRPGIPPNSLLIFEVELVSAEHPAPPPAPLTSDIVKVPSLEEMKKGAKIEVIKPEDVEKAQQAQPTNSPPK